MVLGKTLLPISHHGDRQPLKSIAAVTAEMAEEKVGFVDEMRAVAMKLHTKEQSREGEKEAKSPEERSPAKWEPSVEGYLKFLVDSQLVYATLEKIVGESPVSCYAEFRNTGLERSGSLTTDLKWFKEQGHVIPEPSTIGLTYASFLEELAKNDPQAFICHFYNVYFAHSAGGRMIGRKVAEKILNKKELEFYKWNGDLRQLLQNVRDKLNVVAETASTCSFRVQIATSCSSVSYTRDHISLSFGDAYGNQVYVARLDNAASRTFEACSTDTFDISGPCTYDVCYVYLYRRGADGWKVEDVRISGQYIKPVAFKYNDWIRSNVWWGFNYCHGSFASPVM